LSEDSKFLAAAYSGITLWDVPTGQRIGNIRVLSATSAFQYDYNYLLVGGTNGVVSLWVASIPADSGYRETGILEEGYVFQSRPSTLVTAFQVEESIVQVMQDNDISFVLTRSGKLITITYTKNSGKASLVTVAQESSSNTQQPLAENGILMTLQQEQKQVIYAGSHQDILVYDYDNQQSIAHYPVAAEVTCIAGNNELLVIGDASGVIHLLSAGTYKLISQLDTHRPVTACAFSPGNSLLAIGDTAGHIALWGVKP